jgi:hypothetical protein
LADQRITQLTALPKAGVAATDVLPIADVSASETKKVTAKDLVDAGLDLVDASSIDLDKLDQSSTTKLGTTALADDAVTYAKIQNVSATDKLLGRSTAGVGNIEEITCTAAGRALLDDADAAAQRTTLGLGTIATQDAGTVAITGGTITGGTITGITDLAIADGGTGASDAATARQNLGVEIGTDVQAYDAGLTSIAGLTTAADQTIYTTAADTYEVTSLTAAGRALLDDADAAAQRTTLGLGSLATASTITDSELSSSAVTAAKLANESTVDLVTTLPASGAFTGQFALDTDDDKLYCWDGASWVDVQSAGSVNTIVADNSNVIDLTITASGDEVTIAAAPEDTASANQFLAGPTNAGGAVAYRVIDTTDLPTATTSAKGAVQVNGEGLRMDGTTIEVDNDVTASATHHVVTYDAKGLITGGRSIISTDLPAAASGTNGAVQPGTGLSVTGAGVLNHTNTVVSATATKITFDTEGHVTAGEALADTDIPSLPASKITSGTFASALFATNSVSGDKLADSSVVQFGGAGSTAGVVVFPVAEYKGQYFYDEIHEDLYLWNGNAWTPITITAGELLYAGTYDASTNTVESVTAAGTTAGLVVSAALPAASANNLRYYVVISQSGTGTSPAPAVALAPPDMLVSSGTSWDLIDVSSGIGSQIASNVTFTPSGGLVATNVQAALVELDNEKLRKDGGTVTGVLEIGSTGSIVFEGSTADVYETTLAVVDPTADRTITLPNVTGTVITTGDTGTVTNTMLAGSIVDSKLSTISTANKVGLNAVDIDGATEIGAALADADLFVVDDGGGGTNRSSLATRIPTYVFSKVSGDVTIDASGVSSVDAVDDGTF